MLRKIANILFIVLAITSCTNNATTEKHQTVRNKIENCYQYLQPIITQYFIDNKSEIWLLFLIAHSKR